MITVTPAAKQYLLTLCERPENQGKLLQLRALDPHTPYAEAGLSFVEPGPEYAEDVLLHFDELAIYVEHQYRQLLEGASIDYQNDGLQQTLVVETPNLQPVSMLEVDAGLEEKVAYLLETEINPSLAMHGGRVQLVEITADNEVLLQFGGGCQGCGMSDVTLKQGIKQTLKDYFPEITAVRDVTDHAQGENPYY